MKALLLSLALLASSCAATEYLPATRADTVLTAAGMKSVGKLVIRGNVVYQAGTGNTANVADNRKAGQKQGSAATAPHATAATTTHNGSVPWWVFALVGVGSVLAWEWLKLRISPLKLLPWLGLK